MRPTQVLSLLLAVLSLSADLAGQLTARPGVFAIRDARIVRVSGPEILNGTIVLRDGLIEEVGPSVSPPADAWVIDGTGLTVYPGFINALSRLGMPDAKTLPATYGKSPASGPDDRPATSTWVLGVNHFAAESDAVEAWRNGGFTTVAVAPRDGIFPGQVSLLNLSEKPAAGAVSPTAALLIQFSENRSRGNGFPSSLFGEMAYIEQVFLDARQAQQASALYAEDVRGLRRPAYDRALFPVMEALQTERPILYPGNTETGLRRALERTSSLSERRIVYGAQQAYRGDIATALAEASAAVLVNLSWPEAPKEPDPDAEVPLRELRFRSEAPSSPKALSAAEVRFGLYADKAKNPDEFMKGLRQAMEAGLSPQAAVEALTLSPSRIYGVDDRLGSLEAGKIANLVVYRDDPFAEKSQPTMVFVDGKKFDVPAAPAKPEKDDDAN